MNLYKPKKGIAVYELLFLVIIIDILGIYVSRLINSYLVVNLINVGVISFTIYSLFYIIVCLSLNYNVSDEFIEINSLFGFRRVKIPFTLIDGYNIQKNTIKGMQLSGVGKFKYSFGRSVIENIGITRTFITSAHNTIYLHTDDMSYGISPKKFEEFKSVLDEKNIVEKKFEIKKNKVTALFKEKSFFIPFIIVSVIVVFIILNPFVLYLVQRLPLKMPLVFDMNFAPVVWGSGKQFAFKQMTYGAMNMIILFCMHYAAYFCAKYDKKSAYKYIYIALICAITFLVLQLKILFIYM